MNLISNAYRVHADDVRNTLAALAARRFVEGMPMSVVDEFISNSTAHLSQGRKPKEVPP